MTILFNPATLLRDLHALAFVASGLPAAAPSPTREQFQPTFSLRRSLDESRPPFAHRSGWEGVLETRLPPYPTQPGPRVVRRSHVEP